MTTAEIISIGDELLIGQTVNTNATWLGQQFALNGIKVMNVTTISDDRKAIMDSFAIALNRNDIVVVTGGLGPTKDDITKTTLCEYFQTDLVINDQVLEQVTEYFEKRGRPMLEVNRLQAAVPKGCHVLSNKNGTAPGMLFFDNDKILISMPGVPYEMKTIFSEEAMPIIRSKYNTVELYHRTAMVQGIGESFLADQMSDWENRIREEGLSLAYLPSPGMVKLRITSFNGEKDAEKVATYFDELALALPKHVYATSEEPIAVTVGKLLHDRKETIGLVESCTSGAVTSALTSVPGSSEYVEGGLVTYSYALKEKLVGVNPITLLEKGAVSEEIVREMAEGGRINLGVDWCIAISGIAGPGGGTDDKPVGTVWFAVSGKNRTFSKKFLFGDNRERNVQMSVLTALNLLRCEILKLNS
ncbi:MAG: competence/damage-inducible protein A [Fluviicola sp.]|jgi:nicotinamide-nucleotide amidase